ncbi:YrdB family protein [Bacillus nitratireducens]|uniref:YrdB family protein n=1 Tax=Bacillus nitratireducens TaxID=2026193 RepID=UPI002E75FCED|nr:YrdB family protein [Bacillus nitratireducens]
MLQALNIALRFMLELCVLGIVGYWGFRVGTITVIKVTLAIILPVIVAIIWALFGAQHAEWEVQGILHVLLEIIVFGVGVAALYHLKHYMLASGLAIIIVVNRMLMFIWNQ